MSKRTFTVLGVTFTPDTISNEYYEYLQQQEYERKRADIIERYRNDCFSDKTLRRITFDLDDQAHPDLSSIAQDYVHQFKQHKKEGSGLLFYGTVGAGKTFLAACIANALIDKCYSVFMTTFSRISNKLQSTWEKQEYIKSLMHYDLLIIDDLGTERNTEYMDEVVISVIDERYRSGKPIIITTNLSGYELNHPEDINKSRIYSRLFEMTRPIKFDGKDRRKDKLRSMLENERNQVS